MCSSLNNTRKPIFHIAFSDTRVRGIATVDALRVMPAKQAPRANQIPMAASQMAGVFQSVPSADTSKACSEFGEYMNHPPLLGSCSHVTNVEAPV